MKEFDIIEACTSLGVCTDGAEFAPEYIVSSIGKELVNNIYSVSAKDIIKEKDPNNKKKNLLKLNEFNTELYKNVRKSIGNKKIPITLGGDHSIAIASSLASIKEHEKLGIIWIDAHADFNTFDTTPSGNIHGLPLAVATGYEKRMLSDFHMGNFYGYNNTVIVGARDLDDLEKENLKDAGIKVFSTQDLKEYGVENVMKKAIEIASKDTNGIHISYDIDFVDSEIAPGVSTPVKMGGTEEEAYKIADIIKSNINIVKSIDIVEFNPVNDKENKTRNIAVNILNKFIKGE